jgi:hypothetical protein
MFFSLLLFLRRSAVALCLLSFLFSAVPSACWAGDGDERYRAYPFGAGFLILDTREGHLWTWGGTGGNVTKNGENDNLSYQGAVRKNMTPAASRNTISSGFAPSAAPPSR